MFAKIQRECKQDVLAYLGNSSLDAPFFINFSHEPDAIIQIKTLLNALHGAEDTFNDLEIALGKGSSLSFMSLLGTSAVVDKAYETIQLLTQVSAYLIDHFQSELMYLSSHLITLKSFVSSNLTYSSYDRNKASKTIGLFLGHAINQMKPVEDKVDYDLMAEFGAGLPGKIQQVRSRIEKYTTQASKLTPEKKRKQLDELLQQGEYLALTIKKSMKGKGLFLMNIIPLWRHAKFIINNVQYEAFDLNDTMHGLIREKIAEIKYHVLPMFFSFVDKLELELLVNQGHFSLPLMEQIKPWYEWLIQTVKWAGVEFDKRSEYLVKLEDSRFIELRLKPIHHQLDESERILMQVEKALLILSQCQLDPSDATLELKSPYDSVKPFVAGLNLDILKKIDESFQPRGLLAKSIDQPALFRQFHAILLQIQTNQQFKKRLQTSLIHSVQNNSRMALFPHHSMQWMINGLLTREEALTTTRQEFTDNEKWDSFYFHRNAVARLNQLELICEDVLLDLSRSKPIMHKGLDLTAKYECCELTPQLTHQPNRIYVSLDATSLNYETLDIPKDWYQFELFSNLQDRDLEPNIIYIKIQALDLTYSVLDAMHVKKTGIISFPELFELGVEEDLSELMTAIAPLTRIEQLKPYFRRILQLTSQQDLIQMKERMLYLAPLNQIQTQGFVDCYVWDMDRDQLSYIDVNGRAQENIVLDPPHLFKRGVCLKLATQYKNTQRNPDSLVLTQELIEYLLQSNGQTHVPGVIHKGSLSLSLLSPSLSTLSSLEELKPYQQRLLQELYERGHVQSSLRSKWISRYALMQPYFFAASNGRYPGVEVFDQRMVHALSGDFISYKQQSLGADLLQDFKVNVEVLQLYVQAQKPTAASLLTQSNEAIQRLSCSVKNKSIQSVFDYQTVGDVAQFMHSDEPLHRKIQTSLKHIFQIDLALEHLKKMEQGKNLLTVQPRSSSDSDWQYIEAYALELLEMRQKNGNPEHCLYKDQMQLYLQSKKAAEQLQIKHYQVILTWREKGLRLSSPLHTKHYDGSVTNMYLQTMGSFDLSLLTNAQEQKIEDNKLYLKIDPQDVRYKIRLYGQVQEGPITLGPIVEQMLLDTDSVTLNEEQILSLMLMVYEQRKISIEDGSLLINRQEGLDLHIWFKYQFDEMESALTAFNQWKIAVEPIDESSWQLGRLMPYFSACYPNDNFQFKSGSEIVLFFKKLENQRTFRDFVIREKSELELKIKKFKGVAQQPPENRVSFIKDIGPDRSDYLMKITTISEQLNDFRFFVMQYTTYLAPELSTRLVPKESGVPFPDADDVSLSMRQPHQIVAFMKLINLIYYFERMMIELEAVRYNEYIAVGWVIPKINVKKAAYVTHFVQAYLQFIQLNARFYEIIDDPFIHLIQDEIKLKYNSYAASMDGLFKKYLNDKISELEVTDSFPYDENAIFKWLSILKLLPRRLIPLADDTLDVSVRLKKSAKKSTQNIEKILNDFKSNSALIRFLWHIMTMSLVSDLSSTIVVLLRSINQKTKLELRSINTKMLSNLLLEADAFERQFGLNQGLVSTPMQLIVDQLYRGFIEPLVSDVSQRIALLCNLDVINSRIAAASVSLNQAQNNRVKLKEIHNRFIELKLDDTQQVVIDDLSLFKTALKGADLHLISIQTAQEQDYRDCFVLDHFSKGPMNGSLQLYYLDSLGHISSTPGGTLLVKTLEDDAVIADDMLSEQPTLIKRGADYFIDGYSSTTREWARTRLDPNIVSKLDLNFSLAQGFDLAYKQLEIRSGNLCVMTINIALEINLVNRYVWDPTQEALYYIERRRCDLHFMPVFPAKPISYMKAKYNHRYLLIANRELFYVDSEGRSQKVQINCFERLSLCNPKKVNHISLSDQQFRDYITSNGGHERQGIGTTLEPIELLDNNQIKAFIATGQNYYQLTNEQRSSLFVENARYPSASKLNLRSPTLTKYGERYFIYGYHPLSAWKYTELDASIVSIYGLSHGASIHIDGQNQYRALYDHILANAGHQVKHQIPFDTKYQALYDEIAKKQGHTFPIRLNKIDKLWSLVFNKTKRSERRDFYLTQKEIDDVILSNSTFDLRRFGLPLSEDSGAFHQFIQFMHEQGVNFELEESTKPLAEKLVNQCEAYFKGCLEKEQMDMSLRTQQLSVLSNAKSSQEVEYKNLKNQLIHDDYKEKMDVLLKKLKVSGWVGDEYKKELSLNLLQRLDDVIEKDARMSTLSESERRVLIQVEDVLPSILAQAKTGFDLNHLNWYNKLASVDQVLSEFYTYLEQETCFEDKRKQAEKRVIIDNILAKLQQPGSIEDRIHEAKNYLNQENRIQVLLSHRKYDDYSSHRCFQLVVRLLECLGLYTSLRVRKTNALIDALIQEPDARPLSCMRNGFFAAPTPKRILDKWERHMLAPITVP